LVADVRLYEELLLAPVELVFWFGRYMGSGFLGGFVRLGMMEGSGMVSAAGIDFDGLREDFRKKN